MEDFVPSLPSSEQAATRSAGAIGAGRDGGIGVGRGGNGSANGSNGGGGTSSKGRAHRGVRGRHHQAKPLSEMTVQERLAAESAAAAAASRPTAASHYPRVRRAPDQSLREDAGAFRPAPPLYRRDESARQSSSRASPTVSATTVVAPPLPTVGSEPPAASSSWRRRGADLDVVFDGGESSARALARDDGMNELAFSPLPPSLAAMPLSALCSTAGARAQLTALSRDHLVDMLIQASAALAAAESAASAATCSGGAPVAKRARRGSG